MKKIRTAIIGQGRSGRDIHGKYFRSEANDKYDIVAVVELDPARREQALAEYPGCVAYSDYTELFARDDIELVVNASYSEMHASITRDLILHKFNVLVEKPMARTRYECEELICLAEKCGVTLAVFQQSLFAPIFLFAKEYMHSGKIGKVEHIQIRYNGFSRRWDWQTIQCKTAGSLYNTGPHPVGYALSFLDFDENAELAFSRLACAVTEGDGDDYAKLIITAPKKPVVDVEISALDTYPEATLKLCGSKGSIKLYGNNTYEAKYIVDGENPPRPVIFESLKNADGNPAYCSETINFHEEKGSIEGTAFDSGTKSFYEMVYLKLTEGKPMEITPSMAARVIGIIEQAHAENPLPVRYTL